MRAGLAFALLAIGVGLTVWCTAGLVLARDTLTRLHYMTPVSTVATFAIALAIVIDGPGTTAAVKALLAFVVTAVTSPITQYYVAHAIWVRRHDGWQLPPEEAP